MIPDEIRDEIEAKCDIQESKNNSRNEKMQEYQNQKGERPAPRKAYSLIEHLHNRKKNVQSLNVQIQGRQKATW